MIYDHEAIRRAYPEVTGITDGGEIRTKDGKIYTYGFDVTQNDIDLGTSSLEFKNLYIEVEGKREDGELPSLFTQIHADVFIEGEVDSKKAYKASELSFTKYCSVSKTLEATADISFSVYVNNKICSK